MAGSPQLDFSDRDRHLKPYLKNKQIIGFKNKKIYVRIEKCGTIKSGQVIALRRADRLRYSRPEQPKPEKNKLR